MTAQEFSDRFDVLYNNITSNLAPGLNEYEKSVFLTKALNETVKNYFTANSKGNNIGQGFDDSAKRQADFSCLMKTFTCTPASYETSSSLKKYVCKVGNENLIVTGVSFTLNGEPYNSFEGGPWTIENDNLINIGGGNILIATGLPTGATTIALLVEDSSTVDIRIDSRSKVYTFPSDVFIAINETIKLSNPSGRILQVVPLRYDEYLRLMSKPYKRPLKYQAWRLINTGTVNGSLSTKVVEIIVGPIDLIASYTIRYIRFPKPIIVGPLDGLTIDDYYYTDDKSVPDATAPWSGCELDPIIHEDILQRAVELAKIAWTSTGQENVLLVMEAGQRSE